jgi:hypothetical protein
VRLRFTGSASNQKIVENATIDTGHQPVRMAVALLLLHANIIFFSFRFRYFEASARIYC